MKDPKDMRDVPTVIGDSERSILRAVLYLIAVLSALSLFAQGPFGSSEAREWQARTAYFSCLISLSALAISARPKG